MGFTSILLVFVALGILGHGNSHTVHKCEHQGDLTFECSSGTIKVIHANFGRTSLDVCPARPGFSPPAGTTWPTDCVSEKSTQVVKERCDGESSCSVKPSNGLFGNQCGRTWKYLEVTYACEPELNKQKNCPGANGLFLPNNGNCFHFSSDSDINAVGSWTKAREFCKSLASKFDRVGDLAELSNPANILSDEWLMETITAKGKVAWLGAHDPNQSGNWFWAHTNRRLSKENPFWGPSEPNRQKTENCLVTWKFGNRNPQRQYIADYVCDRNVHYVCQLFN